MTESTEIMMDETISSDDQEFEPDPEAYVQRMLEENNDDDKVKEGKEVMTILILNNSQCRDADVKCTALAASATLDCVGVDQFRRRIASHARTTRRPVSRSCANGTVGDGTNYPQIRSRAGRWCGIVSLGGMDRVRPSHRRKSIRRIGS